MVKFEVRYLKPKKKGYAQQTAVFFKIEDAMHWEDYVKEEGCKEVQLTVK